MKSFFNHYLLLIFCFLVVLFPLEAQPWAEVSNSVSPNFHRMKVSADAVLSEVKTQKGKGFKAFKRWEQYWERRVFQDGSFPPANLVQVNWESRQLEKSSSALIPGSSWTSLGPNSSTGGYAGIGRINRITFHPTNTNIIFACTAGGGLWKTSNGGSSWVPLTDHLASIGTSGLVINPVDPNIMYLATGDGDGADTYSYGVLKSTDGGLTWNATGLTFSTGVVIYKLQGHSTDPNIILAGTNNGLFRTSNGGSTWTKVVSSGQFYDVESLTGTNNMVAVTKGSFYRSTDGGATWVLATTITSTGRIALAVSPANPNFVAALVSNTSNGFKGFYASVDGGLTYTLRSSSPNVMGWETNGSDSGGQAWYDLCMAISPVDINQIIVGGVNTWKSTNGGVSWTIMTNWYQTSTIPAMHADHHDLIFQNSTTIFSANDGGIYKSTNNGVSWTDLTNGMSISQLYRASASQTDIRVIAGLQDNGTKLRSTTGTWSDEIGGDGMDCAIDPTNPSYMYGTLYYGDIQRSANGGNSWSSITPPTGADGAWVSPVLLDPVNPAVIYLGYKDLMKSADRGTTWTKISQGQTGGSFISNIAVAPSDPQVIYISWGSSMAKTINGGTSWASISSPNTSTISSVLVDPTNPNNIYVTFSNFTAGAKVYQSSNGGTSWTNISGTLPNIPANKIIYQTGSNGALYLGMDVGVYYRDHSLTDWSLFNSGLPNVEIFDLEIRYSDKKLIAATYGRGLWESPLYAGVPLAVPVISSFSPTSGPANTNVTITGSNFNGITAVSFGGVAASSFVINSSTSINAKVGNGASGNVVVTNASGTGTLAGFTFINSTPTITSFTPNTGKTGQVVTITGTNFTGATSVRFGGTAASSFSVVSATSITATVGSGTSGNVSVTTASGTGTLAGFTYVTVPNLISFSPSRAAPGTAISFTGTGFHVNPTNNIVWIGATKANVTASTGNSISATVPLGSSTDYIRVLNRESGLATQSNNFFIATFSPSRDSISSSDIAPKIDLNTLANPEDIRVSDIDGDGKPDIIVANYTPGSISVYRNTTTSGNIQSSNFNRSDFISGTNATFISVADLDNDGMPDLIVANQGENSISIFKNRSIPGTISFNNAIKITTLLTPIGIGVGDFDRNGWLDIATVNHGNNSVSIFTNRGIFNSLSANNFNSGFKLTAGLNPITIDVADIDGDSKVDIAVGNYGSGTVSIFKNNYSGGTLNTNSFSPKTDFIVGSKPGYLKLGDMDGDAKLDIVVLAESTNSVSILRNTSTLGIVSSSSFAPRINLNTGGTPYYISVGDMTGNGKLDIFITNFADGTATLWQNKSVPGSITSSSFFKRLNFTVGTKPFAGLLADIDGDRKTDMIVSNSGSNTLSILRNGIGSQLVVSPTSTNLPATGGSFAATISSNLFWKVASDVSWLIPVSTSGNNSGTLRVIFAANSGGTRKGVISFIADGVSKTMEISQAAKPGLLDPGRGLNEGTLTRDELKSDLISDNHWTLSPNPSDGTVYLTFNFPNLELTGTLHIQDINGRSVRSLTQVRTGTYEIDLSLEPKGTYLFSLKGEKDGNILYKKLMIQ